MNNRTMEKARNAPRCGAKARTTGKPCQCPAMPNGRCRIHGGKSTGAPSGKGNGNYKNGKYTKRHKELKKATQAIKAAIRQNDHDKADRLIDGLETMLE
ncbi:MAG: HGGxSTG domain-containing protein [Methylovulum sp.]|uniref:HGGxSTG domain-containing protein n=1 Tax=Methylovulum sp. TaxID=1916980 RepID=UPI0026041C83|nr:HGGxSTG domain-containing protein [Methylovulum sp.]MDD2723436.1 HGGxSTG domain-containing protein [Methylovulum sp.]MDD5125304.1 HGGxSTG domain-containing protein [Methylovulum sp.]